MVVSAKLSVKVLMGTMAVLVLIGMGLEELAAMTVSLFEVSLMVAEVLLLGALLVMLMELRRGVKEACGQFTVLFWLLYSKS